MIKIELYWEWRHRLNFDEKLRDKKERIARYIPLCEY